jgi:hypothetical protein
VIDAPIGQLKDGVDARRVDVGVDDGHPSAGLSDGSRQIGGDIRFSGPPPEGVK